MLNRLLRPLLLALATLLAAAPSALADPDLAPLNVPICGNQTVGGVIFRCLTEWDLTPDVRTFEVPGGSHLTVEVGVTQVFNGAAWKNELFAFRVDDPEGSVDGLLPGEDGYIEAALVPGRARVLIARDHSGVPSSTVQFRGGTHLIFGLVANGSLEDLIDGPANAVYSHEALNYWGEDRFIGFRRQSGGMTQFSFEDNTQGGDRDYDDMVFTVSPEIPDSDADRDGLPTSWELNGVDTNGNGTIDIDLPAMGASPNHKDVFVELDAMQDLRLSNGAIEKVVEAFKTAPVTNPDGKPGIRLHVDNGSDSVMNPDTGAKWGKESRASTVDWDGDVGEYEGERYDWDEFDEIKDDHFDPLRQAVFHYGVSVHEIGGSEVSGLARPGGDTDVPGSDFMIALAEDCSPVPPAWRCPRGLGSDTRQAGTFMHELGHNLGLDHGGHEPTSCKPNHLSVMNYNFQFTGVSKGGKGVIDYSRHARELPPLDERALNEQVGIPVSRGFDLSPFKTATGCDSNVPRWISIGSAVDLDRDGKIESGTVEYDLNDDDQLTVLTSSDDWSQLRFGGGWIGGAGAPLPRFTVADEPSVATLERSVEALVRSPGAPTAVTSAVRPDTATVSASITTGDEPVRVWVEYAAQGTQEAIRSGAVRVAEQTSTSVAIDLAGLTPGTRYDAIVFAQSEHHTRISAPHAFTTTVSPPPIFQDSPGPPTPSPAGPLTPAKPVAKPVAAVKLATRLVRSRAGRWTLEVRCLAKATCRGTIAVRGGAKRAILLSGSFSIRAQRSARVTLKSRKSLPRTLKTASVQAKLKDGSVVSRTLRVVR